jgi:hypothetical protein
MKEPQAAKSVVTAANIIGDMLRVPLFTSTGNIPHIAALMRMKIIPIFSCCLVILFILAAI